MIGSLLKQLMKGLGVFIQYRFSRIFKRRGATSAPPNAVASPAQIAALNADVGLDPSYTRVVPWRTDRSDVSLELQKNPVYRLWVQTPQGEKWTHYFEVYEEIFHSRQSSPMKVLEIGVLRGASLRLWKRYFHHPETSIIGIDINPSCASFDAPSENIHVRIGSQADAEFLRRVVDEFGPFDLIIDDGSHFSTHMIKTFNCLYARGLADDGIYFVEDCHANYWLPWRDSAKSFLDFSKDLLELMHSHYQKADLSYWSRELETGADLALEVPEITTMIKEMRFFDSIVVIYKTRRTYMPRYIIP